jgi:hypothetical protein
MILNAALSARGGLGQLDRDHLGVGKKCTFKYVENEAA